MSFFQRFTQSAQRCLKYAGEEARGMGYNYIGTEHLLMGIIRETGGNSMNGSPLSIEKLRETVEKLTGKGDFDFSQEITYTPRSVIISLAQNICSSLSLQNPKGSHIRRLPAWELT